MKASKIAAKLAVRLFLFLILLVLVPFFTGNTLNKQLHDIYITTSNKWVLAYPILLVSGFIALLVICTIKNYSKPDLNWLLVLNTAVLIIYGLTVYVRLSQLIK